MPFAQVHFNGVKGKSNKQNDKSTCMSCSNVLHCLQCVKETGILSSVSSIMCSMRKSTEM